MLIYVTILYVYKHALGCGLDIALAGEYFYTSHSSVAEHSPSWREVPGSTPGGLSCVKDCSWPEAVGGLP